MNRGTTVDARVSQKAVWGGELGRPAGLLTILALTLFAAGCGDLTTQGTGSSYLIITSLQGASGAEPESFPLRSTRTSSPSSTTSPRSSMTSARSRSHCR